MPMYAPEKIVLSPETRPALTWARTTQKRVFSVR